MPLPIPFSLNKIRLNESGLRVLSQYSGSDEIVTEIPLHLWKPRIDSQGREIVVVVGSSPEPGSSDYNDLDNKPTINSVPLQGNNTAENLGLTNSDGSEPVVMVTPSGGTATIDLSCPARMFALPIAAATTITFANAVIQNSTIKTFELHINLSAAVNVTWPAGIVWIGGTVPTLTSGKITCIVFRTTDGVAYIGNKAYEV